MSDSCCTCKPPGSLAFGTLTLKVDGYSPTFIRKFEIQIRSFNVLFKQRMSLFYVQMKTTICNSGNAYCPCAVAIRAGGDVFMIKLCAGSKFIGYTSCTDNGILEVEQKSQFRYKVTLICLFLHLLKSFNNLTYRGLILFFSFYI